MPRPWSADALPRLVVQLVLVELAAGLGLAAAVGPAPAAVGCGVGALLLLVIALGRRHGRWLFQWVPVAVAFRQRRRRRTGVPRPAEPGHRLLAEVLPGARVHTVASQWGTPCGVVGTPERWAAVVELVTADLVQDTAQRPAVSLTDLAAVVAAPDLRLAGVQQLTWTVPAPVTSLPPHALARRSYASLVAVPPPARRRDWLVLRLEPAAAVAAVDARGGGTLGAHRTLLSAASRVVTHLTSAGLPARVLDADALTDAVSLAGTSDRAAPRADHTGPVTDGAGEQWQAWLGVDGLVHASYAVAQPVEGALPDLVGAVPATAIVCGVSQRTADGAAAPQPQLVLRLCAGSETELGEADAELTRTAHRAGLGLRRLDGQHLPGLLATLPLGGWT